jgi:hypothetical protein
MTFARVSITLGSLDVCIETDHIYPDAMNDMANRAVTMLSSAFAELKENGVDISDIYHGTVDDEDEDEDA